MLPALVAVSGSLAAGQAGALELGELQVQSKLGQPLRASIAFALGPNELIDASCVSIRPTGGGLPSASGATISVANGVISLTGRTAVREPLMTANLVVNCPYTPHVSRDLMLFVDPTDVVVYASQTAPVAVPARPAPAARARTEPVVRSEPAATPPIEQASRYRVLPGDSLSAIAGRLQAREIGLQAAMNAIFEANPEAFLAADPNLLQAGSWLTIPSFAGGVVTLQTVAAVDAPAPEAADSAFTVVDTTADTSVYDGAGTVSQEPVDEPAVTEPVIEPVAGDIVQAPVEPAVTPTGGEQVSESKSAYANLLPGDVIIDDNLVADNATYTATSREPATASPTATSDRPVRGMQIIATPERAESSSDWLIWLAAGVISVFGAFLIFGQRLRERFGSTPVGASRPSARPQSAQGTPRVAPISVADAEISVEEITPAYDDVDFDLSDDSPTEENLALDADLFEGTGLEQSTDMDVNQDFGFAVTTELDIELPESSARENESPETDIIPPPERTRQEMVIDSEVLPDDSQYEMSVLVDVTKMPNPDDVTERDLKAVAVEDNGQTLIGDAYTINKEVDLEVLEKDYEDEFTATQKLSKEIEMAAAELAESMDSVSESDDDTSVEMQLTDIADLDVTSSLEAQNDDIGEDDITAQIDADDKTVEMPGKDRTKAS
jgi:phage tail protein X